MTENPYQAPQSESAPPPARGDVALLTNAIGVICVLPGFGLLISLPLMRGELLSMWLSNPSRMATGLLIAICTTAAGGLLLALRPWAVHAFVLSLTVAVGAQVTLQPEATQSIFWSAVLLAGLAYSLWLRSRGALRSRPNNSSKPTPLRGAA